MDDDDEFFEDEDGLRPSAPIHALDWLIVFVNFIRALVGCVEGSLHVVELLLCGHANHKVDQARFEDEARRQIEMMTEQE